MKFLLIPLFILVFLIGFMSKKRVNRLETTLTQSEDTTTLSKTAQEERLTKGDSPYLSQIESLLSNRPAPDEVAPEWIYGLIDMVEQWAKDCKNPQEVVDFLLKLEPVALQETLLESAFTGFGQQENYKTAVQLAYDLDKQGINGLNNHLRWIVSGQISKKNYAEMGDFISNFPDESKQAMLLDFAFDDWAKNSPLSLADSLDSISDENEKSMLIPQLASIWGECAPKSACAYVSKLPTGELKSNAFLNLVDSWGKNDPESVSDWIISKGSDPDLDLAVSSFAQYVDIETYGAESVLEWAMSVNNPTHREEAVLGVLSKLKNTQPEKTKEWIANLEDEGLRQAVQLIE